MPVAYNRVALSKKKRKAFLKALVVHGGMAEPAARAVGYTDTAFLRQCRKNDEEFAEAWDLMVEAAGDSIEAEMYRRAVHGVMEPVFYKGEITGYIHKYSDRLGEVMLKRHKPEYRDSRQGGEMNINVGVAVMPARAINADEWEERAKVTHNQQTVIEIEDKPKENLLERTIKRGD